jgi:microcystin degradation protein MlrC
MLEVLRQPPTESIGGQRQAEVAPLVYASTTPGGPLTDACDCELKGDILARLREALPIDGLLAPLHGSTVVEGIGHLEDDLLLSMREVLGWEIPIVGTLDLHAHVTEPMIRSANALFAWETYPHRDSFSTGQRAARMMMDILDGTHRPAMAIAKVPVLVSGVNGSTEGSDPFAEVMRYAKAHEGHGGVLSTSVLLVHPYLDLPDMGGGGLVIAEGDVTVAEALALKIAREYWARRFALEPEVLEPAAAIERGLKVEGGPVLLVETADCAGGGAVGDSVHTLRALLAARLEGQSLAPVVDPEAAALCHKAGPGAEVKLTLGFKIDPHWGEPLTVTGRVERLSDGRFLYSGGVWGGQWGEMGPSAVLRVGTARVLITTHATYDWADEQYASMGLDVRECKFVVVKNPMNYRLGYGHISKAAFILDTPGPTPATLRHVRYTQVRRPYFPADQDIPGLVPTVWSHRA